MSNPPNVTSYTWGPGAQRAAVSVTFDNLGEPADLERGLWPESEPLGRHFSVKRMLPRILGMLEELGLQATFTVLPGVAPYCVPGGVRVVSEADPTRSENPCRIVPHQLFAPYSIQLPQGVEE